MDSKREGMDREWTAKEMEWTGNGQQERGNGQGMDREWTGRCGVRNLRCLYHAEKSRDRQGDKVMPVGVLAEFGQLTPTHAHTHM